MTIISIFISLMNREIHTDDLRNARKHRLRTVLNTVKEKRKEVLILFKGCFGNEYAII